MRPVPALPQLRHLDEQECRDLLESTSFGRIAVTERALPTIVPVLFTVRDDTVVVVSPARSPALAASEGNIVTLEIDTYDPATAGGWSVTVVGPVSLVSDSAEIEALDRSGIAPWAASHRHYIKIDMARIAGRQLVTACSSTDVGGDHRP